MNEKRAGVIGLGQIGGGIAISLQNSGVQPIVNSRRRVSADILKEGYVWADTPKAVAEQSDVVMVCVVSAEQVYTVLEGNTGLLAGAHEGLVVCIVSTVSVDEVRKIAEACRKAGAECLDCGVTPGNLAAKNGMVAMCGGNEETFEAALPVLNAWSKQAILCGAVGSGMAVKLARNVVTYGGWRIVKEAQQLVQAAGGNPKTFYEILQSGDAGTILLSRLRTCDETGKVPPEQAEKLSVLMHKDLAGALELADELSVILPATQVSFDNTDSTFDICDINDGMTAREKGAVIADHVFGKGFGAHLDSAPKDNVYNNYTLETVFGDLWARPGLSIHERRLLCMGIVSSLGRADLIRVQALGALRCGEMTEAQLQELSLHCAFYAGWANAGAVARGVKEAIEAFHAT